MEHSSLAFTPIVSATVRDVLSFKEAVVLAKIPEDRVRKDIEKGWLVVDRASEHRIVFRWPDSIALAAIYNNSLLSMEHRKTALEKFKWSFKRSECISSPISHSMNILSCVTAWAARESMRIDIDNYVFIDLAKVIEEIMPRLGLYVEGLGRIEERKDVLGGDAVFRGTRLPVMHVGEIYNRGETAVNIMEDYPYLNKADIEFAKLYFLSHPALGRPKLAKESRVNGKHAAG